MSILHFSITKKNKNPRGLNISIYIYIYIYIYSRVNSHSKITFFFFLKKNSFNFVLKIRRSFPSNSLVIIRMNEVN